MSRNRVCSVYCHTNLVNGKRYVGITTRDPVKRWARGTAYKHNPYFTNAINKYGWDSFKHEVLFENVDEKEAKEIEKKLINEYKTTDRNFGYNQSTGGEPMRGVRHSAETRQKMSVAAKNKVVKESAKKLLSEIMKNRPQEMKDAFSHYQRGKEPWNKGLPREMNPVYGRKYSDERRENMSHGMSRNWFRHIPTGKIYKSYKDLSKEHNVSSEQVHRHCNNKVKNPVWEYIEKEGEA